MFMSGKDFRESLRAYKPSVYVNGRRVKSVAGDAEFAPGINAIGLTPEKQVICACVARCTPEIANRQIAMRLWRRRVF